MMIRPAAYFWKRAPFLRLLPGLVIGILVQWYVDPGLSTWLYLMPVPFGFLLFYAFIPHFRKFSWPALPGIATMFLFAAIGGALAWQNDIRNDKNWFGRNVAAGEALVLTISTPLVEKERSWRADASVNFRYSQGRLTPSRGRIILYLDKDSLPAGMGFGSRLLLTKPLQEIRGPFNPGAFDYRRYCLFRGITHQAYLQPRDYLLLPISAKPHVKDFIFQTKEKVLGVLRRFIAGRTEAGLAEALLLGYKHDLDKALVQSYSNTGVVHIIAVSGLHLGLVYMLLGFLCRPLRRNPQTRWLGAVVVIAGLWLFSLLAGAQASVLRSALMFTCIVIGENLGRKTSVFNTMAVSAFILVCMDPFIIWDAGFQLSYAAVASIILFMKPVYNWCYFRHPLVDLAWKMNAVTMAAQVLTLPLTLYHFNQFPPWFMVTNFVAVPLSSAILLGEILLCACSFLPSLAERTGNILSWLISVMNQFIERMEQLPFALLTDIQMSSAGVLLLFMIIAGLSWWLMGRSAAGALAALVSLLLFTLDDAKRYAGAARQRLLIVYQVPKKTAIDIVEGKRCWYYGDGDLVTDPALRKLHLVPTRIAYRVRRATYHGYHFAGSGSFALFGKRMLVTNAHVDYVPGKTKPVIDLLLVSGNQYSRVHEIMAALRIRQVVLDSSVPARAAASWKKESAAYRLPVYDVTTDGAFVMKL